MKLNKLNVRRFVALQWAAVVLQYHARITLAGELIIRDERSRYQLQNKANCLQKLRDIIEAASCQPEEPHKLNSEQRRLR